MATDEKKVGQHFQPGNKFGSARKREWTPNVVRERMRVAAIVRRLQKFVLGEKGDQGEEIKMTAPQVSAALGLLKKAVPDLSSVEFIGEMTHRQAKELTDAELQNIAAGGGLGIAEASAGATKEPAVH